MSESDSTKGKVSSKQKTPRTVALLVGILVVVCLIVALWLFGPNVPGLPATVDQLPNAPSDLSADHVPIYDLRIGWQDNSDNEDGFRVYRRRTDVLTNPALAGTASADEVNFRDLDVFCGATYQYIVASYNEAGESPASVCWEVTMPQCPVPQTLNTSPDPASGFNFLSGILGAPNDVYVAVSSSGQIEFMADQDGQPGLFDLGDIGATPLYRVDFPDAPTYVRFGLPISAGHSYIARLRDQQSLAVFTASQPGTTIGIDYIVWTPTDVVDPGLCAVAFDPHGGGSDDPLVAVPGGPCISGDGICDPTCTASGDGPASPGSGETLGTALATCGAEGRRILDAGGSDRDAREAIDRCMVVHTGRTLDELRTEFTGADPDTVLAGPARTEVDFDCTSTACVPGDGVCSPVCGVGPALGLSETGPPGIALRDSDGDGTPDEMCRMGTCEPLPPESRDFMALGVPRDVNGDGVTDALCFGTTSRTVDPVEPGTEDTGEPEVLLLEEDTGLIHETREECIPIIDNDCSEPRIPPPPPPPPGTTPEACSAVCGDNVCACDENTSCPQDCGEDLCKENGGTSYVGDTCVCPGIIDHVTVCVDGRVIDNPTDTACTPNQSCQPGNNDSGGSTTGGGPQCGSKPCGNSTCQPECGENPNNCPADCP